MYFVLYTYNKCLFKIPALLNCLNDCELCYIPPAAYHKIYLNWFSLQNPLFFVVLPVKHLNS